jgi:hypothetical protein
MKTSRLAWFARPGARALEALIELDQVIDKRKSPTALAPYCCSLAFPHSSTCYSRCMSKGGGYWIQYWWCCYGSYRYQCQECTTGDSCYGGSIYCSAAAQGPSC